MESLLKYLAFQDGRPLAMATYQNLKKNKKFIKEFLVKWKNVILWTMFHDFCTNQLIVDTFLNNFAEHWFT